MVMRTTLWEANLIQHILNTLVVVVHIGISKNGIFSLRAILDNVLLDMFKESLSYSFYLKVKTLV